MRRLLRILWNGATVVSALVCAFAVVVWARSYWVEDYAFGGNPGRGIAVFCSARGSLWVGVEHGWPRAGQWAVASEPVNGLRNYVPGYGTTSPVREWAIPGAKVVRASGWLASPAGPIINTFPAPPIVSVSVRWWLPALVASVLPAAAAVRRWRSARLRNVGLCRVCGYDLRGNVSGVCPECGAPTTVTA
jgi:hypothetical protein